jgi:plasmid stabilization system protein ParE
MRCEVIFHPLIETELIETFNWYQERKDGFGNLFRDEINKKIVEIASHPERYPLVFKCFRQTAIKKFPFVIIYEFIKEENYILISSVFHTKRNPEAKFRK